MGFIFPWTLLDMALASRDGLNLTENISVYLFWPGRTSTLFLLMVNPLKKSSLAQ